MNPCHWNRRRGGLAPPTRAAASEPWESLMRNHPTRPPSPRTGSSIRPRRPRRAVGAAVLALAILAGTLAMGMPAAGAAEAHGTRCVGVRHAHWQAQVGALVRRDRGRVGNTQIPGGGG